MQLINRLNLHHMHGAADDRMHLFYCAISGRILSMHEDAGSRSQGEGRWND
jgi:hypothetical protein